MAATALAQEKVWFDKPSYDKAACLHFERLARKGLPNVMIALGDCAKVVGDKKLEHRQFVPSAKDMVFKVVTQEVTDTTNAQWISHRQVVPSAKDLVLKVVTQEVTDTTNAQWISHRQVVPSAKDLVLKVVTQEVTDTANEQWINALKKSKDKNNKAAKRHRNLKKSKSDAVDTKEEITAVQQESQQSICPIIPASGSLANEIAKARQHIKKSLQCMNGIAACTDVSMQDVVARVASLEKDNQELRNSVQELKDVVKELEKKVNSNSWPMLAVCPAKPQSKPVLAPAAKADEGDDDVDLFGSDSEGEDAEAAKIREERLAAYAAKKSKKPVLIAKSNIILDVKPWDDETDMKVLESEVRKIGCDGLLWGAAKLVPLAYGIHKLQISCVVEDDKVSVDWLTEAIQEIEEYVQSVDIAAFNKV